MDDAPVYDRIGVGYATRRRDDPRFAAAIRRALGDATRILNVGAGTGSYEPSDCDVTALEPSEVMIRQRPPGRAPVVRGVAELIPFGDQAFDATLAVLTVHHWSDPAAGLAELCRVSRRRVIVTFDPREHDRLWLMDYIPELAQLESVRGPSIPELVERINGTSVVTLPVPHDCSDGMTVAYWRRPAAYLDPEVRLGSSCLRQAAPSVVERGLRRLEADLRSGAWQRRYGNLLELSELDCGMRLIVGQE